MTIRHQIEIESVTFLLLASIAGITFAFYTGFKPNLQNKISLPVAVQDFQTPTPTEIPKPQTASQISPDGTKILKMMTTTNENLSRTYVFITSDADDTNQQIIYSATNSAHPMSIPFNTWSPDNKYVFVTETTFQGDEAIVLKANGEPITDTEVSINATRDFMSKITDNLYDKTTGWASYALLLVNTKTPDGKEGISYWFEIPTKAIIPLSTPF